MRAFDFSPRTRVVFGEGALDRLGDLAAELGFRQTLIVSDRAIVETGLVARARASLRARGIESCCFSEFTSNPDSAMVEAGRAFASSERIDSLVGLGGGSSMDCAKGINFVLTSGGRIRDYWGQDKASGPMLPSIGIPTTAGTGSEAQRHALISDAETHVKMACGDPKAAFRIAILDPLVTLTQPRSVAAEAGFDAISHAVESFVTSNRTRISSLFARDAWQLLEANYERVLDEPDDVEARGAMLLGAHEAGIAIELSMLGATHACANPLTARYGTTHAVAIALMLPHVVRWNSETEADDYAELLDAAGHDVKPGEEAGSRLASRLDALRRAGGLPGRLREAGVRPEDFDALAENAAEQWTGRHNPRPFDAEAARRLYESAY